MCLVGQLSVGSITSRSLRSGVAREVAKPLGRTKLTIVDKWTHGLRWEVKEEGNEL